MVTDVCNPSNADEDTGSEKGDIDSRSPCQRVAGPPSEPALPDPKVEVLSRQRAPKEMSVGEPHSGKKTRLQERGCGRLLTLKATPTCPPLGRQITALLEEGRQPGQASGAGKPERGPRLPSAGHTRPRREGGEEDGAQVPSIHLPQTLRVRGTHFFALVPPLQPRACVRRNRGGSCGPEGQLGGQGQGSEPLLMPKAGLSIMGTSVRQSSHYPARS